MTQVQSLQTYFLKDSVPGTKPVLMDKGVRALFRFFPAWQA